MRMLGLVVAFATATAIVAGLAGTARAAWLDLADGTYAVTLDCTFSTTIVCPSSINGTMTVDGAGLSFMDFVVNGQSFSGDPTDGEFQNAIAHDEISQIVLSPFSFLSIRNNLDIAFGPGDHWWVYCVNTGSQCQPTTQGTWTATRVDAVPEPAGLGLLALGLAGIAIARRRVSGPARSL